MILKTCNNAGITVTLELLLCAGKKTNQQDESEFTDKLMLNFL